MRTVEVNLNVLKAQNFEQGFAEELCAMVSLKLSEFRSEYEKLICSNNTQGLSDLVHDLVATLRFLELEEMCDLINRYESVNFNDNSERQELIDEVNHNCLLLEKMLLDFKEI